MANCQNRNESKDSTTIKSNREIKKAMLVIVISFGFPEEMQTCCGN